MLRKAARKREKEGDQHEGESRSGENDVTGEEWQVDGAIRGVEGVAYISVQIMMQDVADEKQGGENECSDHRRAMGGDSPRANERKPDEESYCAEPVEDGIEGWKEGESNPCGVGGWVLIDQPKQKERSACADGQDGKNGRASVRFRVGCGRRGPHSIP